MDASLFQFFIEEFGDSNCTLVDAFQHTLYGNASFASMSVDGGDSLLAHLCYSALVMHINQHRLYIFL